MFEIFGHMFAKFWAKLGDFSNSNLPQEPAGQQLNVSVFRQAFRTCRTNRKWRKIIF